MCQVLLGPFEYLDSCADSSPNLLTRLYLHAVKSTEPRTLCSNRSVWTVHVSFGVSQRFVSDNTATKLFLCVRPILAIVVLPFWVSPIHGFMRGCLQASTSLKLSKDLCESCHPITHCIALRSTGICRANSRSPGSSRSRAVPSVQGHKKSSSSPPSTSNHNIQ